MSWNTLNTYSIANELKYDIHDADEKHQLYKQFIFFKLPYAVMVVP